MIIRIFLLLSLFFYAFPATAGVKVLTSILPIHSLASLVTKGVSEPDYLVGGGFSPHSYTLKPSDIKKISQADVIFIIDKDFESFLSKALEGREEKTFFLSKIPGIKLLPLSDTATINDSSDFSGYDFHLWLDTNNAENILRYMSQVLSTKDPNNKDIYEKNVASALQVLSKQTKDMEASFLDYKEEPFLVFHNGWQYFTSQNGLNVKGSILAHEEVSLSIKRRLQIEEQISEEGIKCIFSEPQFSNKIALSLAKKKELRIEEVDPLGSNIAPGSELYYRLIENAVSAMKRCLRH